MVTLTAKLTVKAGKEQEFEDTMKKVVPEVRNVAKSKEKWDQVLNYFLQQPQNSTLPPLAR